MTVVESAIPLFSARRLGLSLGLGPSLRLGLSLRAEDEQTAEEVLGGRPHRRSDTGPRTSSSHHAIHQLAAVSVGLSILA